MIEHRKGNATILKNILNLQDLAGDGQPFFMWKNINEQMTNSSVTATDN